MTTRRQTTGRSANEDLLLLDAFKRLKRLNRRIMPYLLYEDRDSKIRLCQVKLLRFYRIFCLYWTNNQLIKLGGESQVTLNKGTIDQVSVEPGVKRPSVTGASCRQYQLTRYSEPGFATVLRNSFFLSLRLPQF